MIETDLPADGGARADRRLLGWLLRWARPYTRRVVLATLLVIGGSALQIAGPLLTAAAVDLYLEPRAGTAAQKVQAAIAALGLPSEGAGGLATLAVLYLISLLLGTLLLAAQGRTMMITGQLVMRDLRTELFAHLQRLELAWFNRTPTGRVITRLTSDVEALNEIFTSGLVDILADLALLGGIASVLFALDWRLALVAFAVLPFMVLLSTWFRRRARTIYREVRSRLAAINTHLQEHIAGISAVQLAGAEARTHASFVAIDAAHRDVNIRGVFYYAVFYPAVELLTAGGVAMLLAFGGIWSTQGTVSLGVLIAFLQYVQRFYRPISDLAENYNVLQASLAAAERLHGLLETPSQVTSPPAPALAPARCGTIAFAGHTGAGKSTLVNLLLRFYDPQEGAVVIDGIDARAWDLGTLRRRFAVVLQEVDCFAGTVRENVSLGRPGIDDARVRWALEQVQAGPLLARLPQGIDTVIGERGAGLSTGERQLVSFARALVADPEFLILDEATAGVDAVTEHAIQQALDRLLVGRTSLVIAHRLATVIGCDRVLVFHAGQLIEQGTHEELLLQGGLYRTLYDLQLLAPADGGTSPPVAAPPALPAGRPAAGATER
jgi:ATP-binding cassette subfamily B protein